MLVNPVVDVYATTRNHWKILRKPQKTTY